MFFVVTSPRGTSSEFLCNPLLPQSQFNLNQSSNYSSSSSSSESRRPRRCQLPQFIADPLTFALVCLCTLSGRTAVPESRVSPSFDWVNSNIAPFLNICRVRRRVNNTCRGSSGSGRPVLCPPLHLLSEAMPAKTLLGIMGYSHLLALCFF